ncbi:DUF4387 domain-containing protein [Roseitranquillus sediminis]|uniref:DUF4387 domain-containing protein n=1 Tax=Roseitranquillus sediminis TaxID=2809051 RepID=UPI001D0C125B|nr:DUF4387 domain-containing protein [Roseitranquillus sediminis]MBM9593882.1 DUF4387 domain-containing protein [Roseitranquillus sediminis]
MPELGSLARLIRSKNAGPFTLTFDVMFDDDESYERVKKAGVLTRESFAALYSVPVEDVMFFEHDAAKAFKISIPRPYIQCDTEDGDAYGGQQHAPLVEIALPD